MPCGAVVPPPLLLLSLLLGLLLSLPVAVSGQQLQSECLRAAQAREGLTDRTVVRRRDHLKWRVILSLDGSDSPKGTIQSKEAIRSSAYSSSSTAIAPFSSKPIRPSPLPPRLPESQPPCSARSSRLSARD